MSSIIDNRDDNTLQKRLIDMCVDGDELWIATAFFSLDALLILSEALAGYKHIRILFGDDADAKQRRSLLELLREKSDEDLVKQREEYATLSPLKKVEALFQSKKVEARCYTAQKFHAKAYLVKRAVRPGQEGIIGSGNFTRSGLKQNIELNVELSKDQTPNLAQWYEERWSEAVQDVVTEDILAEIRRQIELYDPYVLYLKALYAWGKQQEADTPSLGRTKLMDALDPHQEQGFLRSLSIIERQHGVMICDGVGLGKSFIALALMEHYCRLGQNVLLIAPKSIMDSSWNGYLNSYLQRFRQPFGSIFEIPMTELGFDPLGDAESLPSDKLREKRELMQRLYERADVIVLDESHNFRTSNASRYKNLMEIVKPHRERKKAILLTATPINTAYRDIGNQLAIITHDAGNIGGYSIEKIKRNATELDKQAPADISSSGQLALGLMDTPSESLNKVLEAIMIQRSRATCKALALQQGKRVLFPQRSAPQCIQVSIKPQSSAYKDLIRLADIRFRPGVEFVRKMREELAKAEKTRKNVVPVKLMKGAPRGIKLAAFLTEQYRRDPVEGTKTYQDEAHLAGLVFANTLKQLESSPAAFQGILQSLGMGLIARLQYVFGDEARPLIARHEGWARTPLFPKQEQEVAQETDDNIEEDGDSLDASGNESDDWLIQAVKARQLAKKLKDFQRETFEIDRWREDIVSDLAFLHEIHEATLRARVQPDPKLEDALPALQKHLQAGDKTLVFTQSQRTAEYLEKELKERLKGYGVARIDSRIEKTRAAILYAFCPDYNPEAHAPSVPKKLDVLICTDVLSEGVNLQQAGAIFSYDIHWNPVRLIQRIGRVDRRLNPEINPDGHKFEILNVLPPDEINDIIKLVDVVENRTLRISKALGLDVSFFRSDDPAGNLKEFNATYEGEITKTDAALSAYSRLSVEPPDEATLRLLKAIPPGAFGVWKGAPQEGLFALFTMETKKASPSDIDRFSAVIGRPVLILEQAGKEPLTDAGAILTLLAGTTPRQPSGVSGDEAQLARRLKRLKDSVRSQFSEIDLPRTIQPQLVCWMELRP